MRHFFVILFFITATNLHAQWVTQDETMSQSLNGIYVMPEGEGWVVGDGGAVYRLNNYGYQWIVESGLPASENFNDVCFVSLTDGWCVGTVAGSSIGKAYHRNAQGTWNPLNPPPGTPVLLAISCQEGSNQNSHFLTTVGFSKTILTSTNSGNVLNPPLIPPSAGSALRDVYFVDSTKGWAVGNSGVITRTTNGGSSWSDPLPTPSTAWLYGVYFFDENLGWAVGAAGTIWATINGGNTWSDKNPDKMWTSERLNAITGIDALHLIAVGQNGTVILSSDGGETWTIEEGFSGALNDVAMIDTLNYWIVGDGGANFYSEGTIKFDADSIRANDRFEISTMKEISFETTFNSFVDIHFRSDSNTTWTLETSNYPASSGSYPWTMPSIPSTGYQLRIRSSQKQQVEAISQPFEIFQKTLSITAPIAGDTLIGGDMFTIRWEHTNVDSIKLMFRESPNSALVPIADSIPASDLQYDEWEVVKITCNQCRILISELDGSPMDSSGFFTIISDETIPDIVFDPVSIRPRKGEDLQVEVTITDDNATTNTLFFRQGGDIGFSLSTSLNFVEGNVYQATIPLSSIDERGLEFYIEAVDHSPSANTAISDTIYRPVSLDNKPHTILLSTPEENENYQMFCIDYELDEKNIQTVLEDEDNLGSYDQTKWRLFHWITNEERYGELTQDDLGEFTRGKSFWIVSVKGDFTTGAGHSFEPNNFVLTLQPGWNQIGHPFAFPVNYGDIIAENSGASGISEFFDYVNKDPVPVTDKLEPRKGYFIKNMNSDTISLTIPPIAADRSPNLLAKNYSSPVKWQIKLEAQADNAIDSYNIVGATQTAAMEWDDLDQPEPPPIIGKYISLYFPHKDWQQYPDHYTTDFRPEINDGDAWDITVATNIHNSIAEIEFKGVESVPAEFQVHVFDEKLKISQDLRQNPVLRFPSVAMPLKKQLKLIVGKDAYFQQNDLEINQIPEGYELSQNFPNPFNPATTIRYGLPDQAKVTLKVYNILGEGVAILVNDEPKKAGYHIAIWDGKNSNGWQVASGVYVYRLQAGDLTLSKKMAILR